jgi:homoserine O-succinyltransferase/O-acetyltransferase
MQLFSDRGQSLAVWKPQGFTPISENRSRTNYSLELALVNNMPDGAVEDTECQFCSLLDSAVEAVAIHLRFYTLPHVPRGERLQRYIAENYAPFQDLFNEQFDGVIITGTEPRRADLKEEPYWAEMVNLLNWSQENTSSAILSCLAAHASVLQTDGIVRNHLSDKRFGIFEYELSSDHQITTGITNSVRLPHSRWNDLGEDALKSAGYTVLTRSSEHGVDSFVKKIKNSMFLHFQGHPEYGAHTLLKEYRRDVKRYVLGERESYPLLPAKYFNHRMTQLLYEFQEKAMAERDESIMQAFPEEIAFITLTNTWQLSARQIYANWLGYLLSKREKLGSAAMPLGLSQP